MTAPRFCTTCGGEIQNGVCLLCKRPVADPDAWEIAGSPPSAAPSNPLPIPTGREGYAGAAEFGTAEYGADDGLPDRVGIPVGVPTAEGAEPTSRFDPSLSRPDPSGGPPDFGDPLGRPFTSTVGFPPPAPAAQPSPGPTGRRNATPPPVPPRKKSRAGQIAALVVVLLLLAVGGGYLLFKSNKSGASSTASSSTSSRKPVSTAGVSGNRQVVGAVQLVLPKSFVAVTDKPAGVAKMFGDAASVAKATESVSVTSRKLGVKKAIAAYGPAERKNLRTGWRTDLEKQYRGCRKPSISAGTNVDAAAYFGSDFLIVCQPAKGATKRDAVRFLVVGDGAVTTVVVSAAVPLWTKDKTALEPILRSVQPKS